jgi:asparagine synthase (glutamine-hydrolysing)
LVPAAAGAVIARGAVTVGMTAICGVIGEWSRASHAGAHLDAMLRALVGSGPGGSAVWSDPDHACRLGVVARCWSPQAPRVLQRDAFTAVCDGGTFDRDRRGDDHLLRSWIIDGPRGLAEVDGQFALAIWDEHARQLVLARDSLGARSLYFHQGRGGVVFASTIEALLAHPVVPLDVDLRSVSRFLTFLNVPVPRTLFSGIAKLPPGSLAVCGAHGVERIERYWSLAEEPRALEDPGHDERLASELHREALTTRMVDGPIAALLGSADSGANVELMSELGARELHTFTVALAGGDGPHRATDLLHARGVAERAGAIHHERVLCVRDVIGAIPRVIEAQDDLVAEPTSVFLLHALEMVREQHIGVVITGDGTDDVSGSTDAIHTRDRYNRRKRTFLRIPRAIRRLLAATAPARYADSLTGEDFWSFDIGWSDHEKAEILTPRVHEQTYDAPASAIVDERARMFHDKGHGDLFATMMQDHFLGNLMLGKLEHLSSRLGVEARCPYTSPAYVRFIYNMPLAPARPVRRDGFRSRIADLFRGRFGDWAQPILLDGGLTNAGVLRRDTLATTLAMHRRGGRDFSTRLWAALVLNLWHERWITRLASERPSTPNAIVPSGGRDSQRKIARARDGGLLR